MDDDATLSDFSAGTDRDGTADDASTDPEASNATTTGTPAAEPSETTAEPSDDASTVAETTLSTYAWGDYTCSRCEHTTDRVWRDDGVLVCPGCKTW